jgi:glycosyltransferase involved in cell wall biosynthesis
MKADQTHISVCICTYRRPQFLKRLLAELARQQTEGLFAYSIVVADNDRTESAKSVVTEFQSASPIEITYCVETQQNIALARNKALANASGDFIAFIDDDEFPAGDWLLTLFKTCGKYRVDGVLGPVKPYFEQDPPRWIIKGKFFDRPTHDTGFIIDWTEGRTGNVLFRKRILDGIGEPFKPEFGSGGEDRNFFMRMMERGHVFAWCDEAVAYEVVPPVRWKRSFMLRRALLRGKMSLNHKSIARGGIIKSVVAVSLYSIALPFLLVLGHHNFMKYLIKLCDHAGRILAFLGFNPITATYVTE